MKIWIIGAVVVAGLLIGWGVWDSRQPGELDAFAQCLDEKGVDYYGAFWCPNCKKQNDMFGRSKKYVPYIECSTPDGRGQLQQCTEAKIEGYPTWEFENGERLVGVQQLSVLAEKTGCELPPQ